MFYFRNKLLTGACNFLRHKVLMLASSRWTELTYEYTYHNHEQKHGSINIWKALWVEHSTVTSVGLNKHKRKSQRTLALNHIERHYIQGWNTSWDKILLNKETFIWILTLLFIRGELGECHVSAIHVWQWIKHEFIKVPPSLFFRNSLSAFSIEPRKPVWNKLMS